MTESVDPRYLEIFPAWLRSLGEDVAAFGDIIKGGHSDAVKQYAAAGLNYLFKSLDLIPDSMDDLGFCDDAFVLRVSAALALREEPTITNDALHRLASDTVALQEFLGEDYDRLESYVKTLRKGAARRRTVDDILNDESIRDSFLGEVTAWSQSFQAPAFARDPKTLIKLRAFLSAKLP
ncbi:hypothetical protein [Pendulispora albinea]|uniref:DUF1232 domain-containing protein n=1 Tax=Pendulispora albinea TaxID=2741071 RepID=A0ABZ2LTQ7_9BACT